MGGGVGRRRDDENRQNGGRNSKLRATIKRPIKRRIHEQEI